MDVDGIVKSVETYLREFITFLASFFFPKARHQKFDDANNTAVFAILSSVFGAYLWSHYIAHDSGGGEDLLGIVIDSLLRWFSLGVVLYVLLHAVKVDATFLHTVLGTVKVLSVAHIVAIYLGYMLATTIWFFLPQQSANLAAYIAYGVEWVFVAVYLPREAVPAPEQPPVWWRVAIARFLFMVLLTLIIITPLAIRKDCYAYYSDNYQDILAGRLTEQSYPPLCQDMFAQMDKRRLKAAADAKGGETHAKD